MKTKAEKTVQSEIIKWVKDHCGWVIKVMKANEDGCPDLLICYKGKFYGVEVKAERFEKNPEGAASPWQLKQLAAIRNAEGEAMCVATLEQFKERIK